MSALTLAPAPAHGDTDDAIDELFKTITNLRSMKDALKNISEEIYGDIEKITGKIVKKFKEDIATRTGQLLHNLQNDKPDKNALRALIQEFPASLEYKNDKGQLPIQSAVWNRKSVGYIPILAEKGNEYDVGGDDKRGGLLL